MNIGKLIRSFRYAFAGVWHVLRTEQNMRVHLVLTVLVISMGCYFRISAVEWCLVILCIGSVTAAECFNSGVERLADRFSQEEHYLTKVAKDASAAGVLLVSLGAAATGLVLFLPKLWTRLMSWL